MATIHLGDLVDLCSAIGGAGNAIFAIHGWWRRRAHRCARTTVAAIEAGQSGREASHDDDRA